MPPKSRVHCCLCKIDIYSEQVPKFGVRPLSKFRTLLKDCLLRKAEFTEEDIDKAVSKGSTITLCESHAPDYLVLGYVLGYVKRSPVRMTVEQKEERVAQSAFAQTLVDKQEREFEKFRKFEEEERLKMEEGITAKLPRKKRVQNILKKAEAKALRKRCVTAPQWLSDDSVFDGSRFLLKGEELRRLINTVMRFKCSCASPVTNLHTEKTAHGAKAVIACATCDAKNVWYGGGVIAEEGESMEEEEGTVDMEHLVGGSYYQEQSNGQFYPSEDVKVPTDQHFSVIKDEPPGYSGDFDLHSVFANGVGCSTLSPSSSSHFPTISNRESSHHLTSQSRNSTLHSRNVENILSRCATGGVNQTMGIHTQDEQCSLLVKEEKK